MDRASASWAARLLTSPLRPVLLWASLYLLLSLLLRAVLIRVFWLDLPPGAPMTILGLLLRGVLLDAAVAGFAAAPLLIGIALLPRALREARWLRLLVVPVTVAGVYGLAFLLVVEYFFFEEFLARFNYIAVDYLIYPHEVFVNIWESYPVVAVTLLCAVFAAAVCRAARRLLSVSCGGAWPRRRRALAAAAGAVWLSLGGLVAAGSSSTWHPNRLANEISGNGVLAFFSALRTQQVDYTLYYPTITPSRAWAIVHGYLSIDPAAGETVGRRIPAAGAPRPLNVVYIIEESLGTEFVGALNARVPGLTPEFDRLAREGLLFERVYATGDRTVRGLEASLVSLPPLPGGSVIRADGRNRLLTLAAMLKSKGYSTAFLYGGNGLFDNLRAFALANGFDRVVEQADITAPVFKNAWGVSDEDLFRTALGEFDRLHAGGRPFFGAILTVSNHRPFTFPAGRIVVNPALRSRANAVRYADYALGQFFREARSHPFYDRTLFVIFGDHGARVYGSQRIPLGAYEVPLLFVCPGCLPGDQRSQVLGSTMDIAPTVMAILGLGYESSFYGRNLLQATPARRWALMQHNRDVALYSDDHLVILGMPRESRVYAVSRADYTLTEVSRPSPALVQLRDDAIAFYQTAYQLLQPR